MENKFKYDTREFCFPVDDLIISLKNQGFKMGVDTYTSIHFLIQKALAEKQFHKLDLWLCPLLARSEEQQLQFRETYKRIVVPALEKNDDNVSLPEIEKPPLQADKERPEQKHVAAEYSKEQSDIDNETKKIVVARLKRSTTDTVRIERFVEETELVHEDNIVHIIKQLRFTKFGQRKFFDIHSTLKKTIDNGGRAMPQYKFAFQHVEYLLLIEKNSERNHTAKIAENLASLFVKNNVFADSFYFYTSPLTCYNRNHKQGIPLQGVLDMHKNAVLLVFADGNQFINIFDANLFEWSNMFRNWQLRFFFSYNPAIVWGQREKMLQKLFPAILPYSQAGIMAFSEIISQNYAAGYLTLKYWRNTADIEQLPLSVEDGLADIDDFFEPELKRWIAACAVYPELNWNLTLALGKLFSKNSTKPMHTRNNINKLTRLEWFGKGIIPLKYRTALLVGNWLSKFDKASIHQFLYKQLEKNKPLPEHKNYKQHALQLAVHDLLAQLEPDKFEQKAKKLKQLIDETQMLPDCVSLYLINESELSGTDFPIPDYLIKQMDIENLQKVRKTTHKNFTEKVGNIAFDMIFVKGGTFKMGSNDGYDSEKPVHSVTVDDFYIGKYEVTNEEFAAFLNDYGSDKVKSGEFAGQSMIKDSEGSYNWGLNNVNGKWTPVKGKEKHPIIYVSWYGANEFCNWLSAKTGQTYRLPTEAQWEYAARGGVETHGRASHKYAGSNNIDEVAWYSDNSGSKTHPVGTKSPNQLGIYDMSGNVWEWCLDWYDGDYYKNSPQKDPVNTAKASARVLRGGGWGNNAIDCRVAGRGGDYPAIRSRILGFRFVLLP